MVLKNNNHSVFYLLCHLILVMKYRRKVIDNTISQRLKEIFEYIQPSYNITLQEWNHDKGHVHILFSAHPRTELSTFCECIGSLHHVSELRIGRQSFLQAPEAPIRHQLPGVAGLEAAVDL